MTTTRTLERAFGDLGELLARHARGAGRDFGRYGADPVGFIREVLDGDPWPKQVEVAEAVRDRPLITVRSCHAAGKDWLGARLALWWVYARRGLVVLTGPTAVQVEEILMRREVRSAFLAGDLPGELHVRALRPAGSGEAGILARTASGIHGMTGLHEERVLFIITEAQDPDLDHAWDAAFAVCTGAEDRILTLGNPTEPDGRFYRAHRGASEWRRVKVAAEDVPNVREGRTVVPGLLTGEAVERFRREYGEASGFYRSRVEAEFPTEAADSLVTAEWIDRAVDLHRSGRLEAEARRAHYTLGVDPARLGPDRTVMCVRRGPVVERFEEWNGLDTMQTADRVRGLARGLLDGYRAGEPGGGVEAVVVDEVGLGGGVLDRLGETMPEVTWTEYDTSSVWGRVRTVSPRVEAFNAAKAAGLADRFRNQRAQAYWTLRKRLEDGRLALPDDPGLREELLAHRVRFGADGRTEIESKDDVKGRIGRSPDLADALVISLAPTLARAGRKTARWA